MFLLAGLVIRHKSGVDGRNIEIQLTEKGIEVFHELNDRANNQLEELLAKLDQDDCQKLLESHRNVKRYFTKATRNIKIRPYQKQDIAYVIERQLSLYESKCQFTSDIWKNYLTQGVITLVEKIDPDKDCMLILECGGNPSGCIAITHTQDHVAQLRYFFLEPELRGLGAGTKLLNEALSFCRQKIIYLSFYGQ